MADTGRHRAGSRELTVAHEESLVADLAALGVRPGELLMVHASLSSVGWIDGGADALLAALRRVLGPTGTLVAYTATPENSISSPAYRRATEGLGLAQRERYRRSMPPFDRWSTPTSPSMGRLSEALRTHPGALRSSHPQTSFAALGPLAEQITRNHPIEQHLGPDSPLGRLYELDARSLLIGVGFDRYTPFHLADYVRPELASRSYSCKVKGRRGRSRWVRFRDLDLQDAHFGELGERVRRSVPVAEGKVGAAPSLLVPLRPAVDAALEIRLSVRSPVLTGC